MFGVTSVRALTGTCLSIIDVDGKLPPNPTGVRPPATDSMMGGPARNHCTSDSIPRCCKSPCLIMTVVTAFTHGHRGWEAMATGHHPFALSQSTDVVETRSYGVGHPHSVNCGGDEVTSTVNSSVIA